MESRVRCRHWVGVWVVGLGLSLVTQQAAWADPVYVVDTGAGASSGGLSLTKNQYLAGQFTLDVGHEINELEGWMIYPTIVGDLQVFAVLYGDDEGEPDLTDEVHSQLFQIPAGFSPGWHGVDGLTLPVYGGTYWLAFEVPTDANGSGAMPPTPVAELDLYAVDAGAGYVTNETARIGVRVLPEPGLATMLVGGVGALAMVGQRRRHRARTYRD